MSTVNFENCPSTNTPLNATNLNKLNYRPKGGGLLLNGNFDLWQRGTSFTLTSGYTTDRWNILASGNVTVTQQANTDATLNASYFTRLSLTNTNTNFRQFVKDAGQQLYNKKSTVSFRVKGSVATTANVVFRNSTQATTLQTVQFNITTSWTKIEITFDASLTWAVDDILELNLGNNYGSLGDFDYAQVKFEVGEVATDFEPKTLEEVKQDCFPYYEKSYDLTINPGTINLNGSVYEFATRNTANFTLGTTFKTQKIQTPTVTLYSTQTGASGNIDNGGDKAATAGAIGLNGFSTVSITGGTTASLTRYHWVADAEL